MAHTIQSLGWFVRRSPDPVRLSAFFRDVLGLPVLRTGPTHTMFWAGETSSFEVNLGGGPQPVYTDRSQAPCVPIFRAHDIDATIARLKKAGVTFINDFLREHNHLAYFLDPDGHVTGLQERYRTSPRDVDHEAWRRWDAGETRIPFVGPMPPDLQHIGWVVLRVKDVMAEIAFYRDVVGLKVEVDYGEHGALLGFGETALLEISEGCPPQPIPNDRAEVPDTFIIRVRDTDESYEYLKSKGVHFVNPPFDITDGRLAYFTDPEGHLVGIQRRRPTSERAEDHEANRRWELQQANA